MKFKVSARVEVDGETSLHSFLQEASSESDAELKVIEGLTNEGIIIHALEGCERVACDENCESSFHKKNVKKTFTTEQEMWARLRDILYHYRDGTLTVSEEVRPKMQELEEFLIDNDHEYFW